MSVSAYTLIAFFLGAFIGGVVVWAFCRTRQGADNTWGDKFRVIAAEALRQSHESFLQLAEGRLKQSELAAAATLDKKSSVIDEMMKPVKETLTKMDAQLQKIEVTREGAYKELLKSVSLSNETQQKLREETGQLLQALRTPTTRGRWGEIQIKRILEMTGMTEYTRDFSAQHHVVGEDSSFRPDYVVAMPGNRCVVIDSKVPLSAYLDGAQSLDNEVKQKSMKQHAKQVRDHIKTLSSKAYWDQVEGSADFVVLFVPGDHFLAGALDADPDLIEYGTINNVLLATPVTLVALLRTVALGWSQENLHKNALKLGELGGELYAAIATMAEHIADMGDKLTGSLKSYNKMIGSLERNVLSKARRLRDFGARKEGKELPPSLKSIDEQPRGQISFEKDDAA